MICTFDLELPNTSVSASLNHTDEIVRNVFWTAKLHLTFHWHLAAMEEVLWD